MSYGFASNLCDTMPDASFIRLTPALPPHGGFALTVELQLFIYRRKELKRSPPPPPIVNNFTANNSILRVTLFLRTGVHEYLARRQQAMPEEFRNARFRQPHRMLRPVRTVARPSRILVRVSQWLPDPLQR